MKSLFWMLILGAMGCGWWADDAPPVIVLVSFDTTRVDALSAYGGADASTPNLDALATRGVRFDMALTPLPTTLGSHTSMMSGLDTHGHHVPKNGTPVPQDIPLLAERLAAAGWDTIAVVGAMPLESSMGLSRGFRAYLDTAQSTGPRRTADQVTDEALQAIDARHKDKPLFVFVHYYDPHTPWTSAPQEIQDQFIRPGSKAPSTTKPRLNALRARSRKGQKISRKLVRSMRKLYLAQVHWTDQELGRLLSGLTSRELMDNSLIIMTADHGEMLDEAHLGQIYTHGPDVDLPVTRVPMIVAGAGNLQTPMGQVVSRPVRLQDIANTVLGRAGLPQDLGTGEDLAQIWAGGAGPPPPHFAEATRTGISPLKGKAGADEWANAHYERAIFHEEAMAVWTPWRKTPPKLYGLTPDQPLLEAPDMLARLKARLDQWDTAATARAPVELDPKTEAALRELGYFD